MIDKFNQFIEISKLLYDKFNLISLLYGSLGLWFNIRNDMEIDDIDILIDQSFINERWNEFKDFLEAHEYKLIDENEHIFYKDGYYFSYASIDELENFADISYVDMHLHALDNVVFYTLDVIHYYKIYNKSMLDGYRINIRKKKDQDKIDMIEYYLDNHMPYWRISLLGESKIKN